MPETLNTWAVYIVRALETHRQPKPTLAKGEMMPNHECPSNSDRRAFLIRTGALAALAGGASALRATPVRAALDADKRKFMEEATRLATESVEKGWGGPFGAVIVKDGDIIGRGQNRVLLTGCPVYHAEITAIIDASNRLNPKGLLGTNYGAGTMLEMIPRPSGSPDLVTERARMLNGCEIYINGAPCPMCMSAIYWSRIIGDVRFRQRPAS